MAVKTTARINHPAMKKALRRVFNQRKARNPSYSYRAFARHLGSSPATLTEYLAGKRRISLKICVRWASLLNVSEDDRRLILGSEKTKYSRLSPDSDLLRELMEHWFYFPILSLSEIESEPFTISVITHRLGLRANIAKRAVTVLKGLGMLKETPEGGFTPTGQRYSVASFSAETTPKGSIKEAFALNNKILTEFRNLSLEERRRCYEISDFSSAVFRLDTSRIVEIKKRITKFRRELAEFADFGNSTEVYQLTLGLIPLTTSATVTPNLSLHNPEQRYQDE